MDAKKKVLIIGAGVAARLLIKEIKEKYSKDYEIIGFVDDDPLKQNRDIENIPIIGDIEELSKIVDNTSVEEIIIAIPSLEKIRLKEIVSKGNELGLRVKILPSTYDSLYSLKTGRPWIAPFRGINIEDLIKRKPLPVNFNEMEDFLSGKTILVTGAGGSIGKEMCTQIAELNPKLLIALDNCEYNLYELDHILREKYSNKINFMPTIKDIKDFKALEKLFKENQIDIVFHAAAYKHVPLMEENIAEAVKNNVFGTYNVLYNAVNSRVKNVVLISTDKAVKPTSVMGTTKKISEMMINLFDNESKLTIVRFGNVLGSKGSIIPLFMKQIEERKPITITHPEITRYFMTIEEAVQLVIQGAIISKNKEILVLDMGEQHKIIDIAKELVQLHGLVPEKDIKFNYIGLREGEKLYEELLDEEENLTKTQNKRIFLANSKEIDKEKLKNNLNELRDLAEEGEDYKIIKKIKEIVNSYEPPNIKLNEGINKLRNAKILIIGGAGFIGTHLKKRLEELDINYNEISSSKEIDISKSGSLEALPPAEVIFHLASKLPQKKQGEEIDFEKDILVTKNIVNFCKKNNSKLIFTSSSAVYGKPLVSLVGEEGRLNSLNEYGISKIACERIIKESLVKGSILRIFNCYGPGQIGKFVIPSLIKDLKEKHLKITEGIKRDFIYVEDVVEALIKVASCYDSQNCEIFNIGYGKSESLKKIAEILLENYGGKVEIEYSLPRIDEVEDIYANIEKAKRELKWEPKISLEEGLNKILKDTKEDN